jgi:hypothetical protein
VGPNATSTSGSTASMCRPARGCRAVPVAMRGSPCGGTSAAPRRLDRGDVDLLHAHHRIKRPLCFIAAGGQRLGQHARRDLPGNAPLVFAPAARALLAAPSAPSMCSLKRIPPPGPRRRCTSAFRRASQGFRRRPWPLSPSTSKAYSKASCAFGAGQRRALRSVMPATRKTPGPRGWGHSERGFGRSSRQPSDPQPPPCRTGRSGATKSSTTGLHPTAYSEPAAPLLGHRHQSFPLRFLFSTAAFRLLVEPSSMRGPGSSTFGPSVRHCRQSSKVLKWMGF